MQKEAKRALYKENSKAFFTELVSKSKHRPSSSNESLNSLKEGLRKKQKVEAVFGFVSAAVNAVSMGAGGGILIAVMGSIVYFGNVAHIHRPGGHGLFEYLGVLLEIVS